MDGALIIYLNPQARPGQASLLTQRLHGQDTTTRGRVYHRHGLLEEIPHWRIKRGVLMVKEEDRERVVKLLREYAKEVYWWPVKLAPGERKRLTLPS